MVTRTKNQKIERIRELIEEYGCNPQDYDPYKIAVEIAEMFGEEREIAANLLDYWSHLGNED